jgi:hypothetical protein
MLVVVWLVVVVVQREGRRLSNFTVDGRFGAVTICHACFDCFWWVCVKIHSRPHSLFELVSPFSRSRRPGTPRYRQLLEHLPRSGMSSAAGKGRSSAVPAVGRTSSIPTPGRPRSASSNHAYPAIGSAPEDEYISRAFADAIMANDPANHRSSRDQWSLSPPSPHFPSPSGRPSLSGRPSSAASSSSVASISAVRATKQVPRPASRTSDVFTRSSSRLGKTFEIGDHVRVESLGFEGVLRYLGEIDGKTGQFAGVELSGGFAGKGKNDGSVNG